MTASRAAALQKVRYVARSGWPENRGFSSSAKSGSNFKGNTRVQFCRNAEVGPFTFGNTSRYLIPMQLRGCGTALVTPFTPDGAVDETALRNLVAWQVDSGIDFLIPCGTTGETPTLTHDEWLRVIDLTVETAAGRVPIVAGATSNSTQDAVAKAKELAERSGVNAILT